MSESLRIALVAEGPTDRIVINAVLEALFPDRSFVLKQLHPEGSVAFGTLGTGWAGVYKWCKQAARCGKGRLSGDKLVFQNFDLLLLHLDADVAGDCYANGSITPESSDGSLPCEKLCPPASATTNALRSVLLSWCGETATPNRTVICMPSKSTEAWVVASLFPNDLSVKKGIECFPDPESRLAQQPKGSRIRKNQKDYDACSDDLKRAWSRIARRSRLPEASRFQTEILSASYDATA